MTWARFSPVRFGGSHVAKWHWTEKSMECLCYPSRASSNVICSSYSCQLAKTPWRRTRYIIPAGADASCVAAATGPQLRLIIHLTGLRGALADPSGWCWFSPFGRLKLVINQVHNEVKLLLEHAITTSSLQKELLGKIDAWYLVILLRAFLIGLLIGWPCMIYIYRRFVDLR